MRYCAASVPWRASSRWYCRSASSSAPAMSISIRSRCSTPTAAGSASIASRTFRMGPAIRRSSTSRPAIPAFKVWQTRFGRLGVGICWDQWFPESARIMALAGAELLLYPTAIGSEPPPAPPVDSRLHWQRTQQGHAAANLMPLVAANRYRHRAVAARSVADTAFLRLVVHRRCQRRLWPRRRRTDARGRDQRAFRSGRAQARASTTGSCSAIAVRTSMHRSHGHG